MTTISEFEKLLEPTEAEITEELKKGLDAGEYSRCTKQDFHEIIEALARDIQSPNETPAQAYVRAIEMTDAGKALYKAYKAAPDTAPGGAEKFKLIAEIQKRADERFPELPTPERRFVLYTRSMLTRTGAPMTRSHTRSIRLPRPPQATTLRQPPHQNRPWMSTQRSRSAPGLHRKRCCSSPKSTRKSFRTNRTRRHIQPCTRTLATSRSKKKFCRRVGR